MERNNKTVVYTREDLQGFCFSDVSEQDKNKYLKEILHKQYKTIKICWILFLPSIILKFAFRDFEYISFTYLYDVIVLFVLLCHVYMIKEDKKSFKSGTMKSHKILMLKKLSVELETELPENGIHKFYPVFGKDIVTGYESKCYISEQKYQAHEEGQVVEIWKLF